MFSVYWFPLFLFVFFYGTSHLKECTCRKHHLIVESDKRRYFPMSSFGFLIGGQLQVNVSALSIATSAVNNVGFTLDRTQSDAMNPYLDGRVSRCTLNSAIASLDTQSSIIHLKLDAASNVVRVVCSDSVSNILIRPGSSLRSTRESIDRVPARVRRHTNSLAPTASGSIAGSFSHLSNHAVDTLNTSDDKLYRAFHEVLSPHNEALSGAALCENFEAIPLYSTVHNGATVFHTSFIVDIFGSDGEGLYSLTFHNCANYGDGDSVAVNLSVSMVERNLNSYLSAGEMQLPTLYFFMALLFFVSTLVWIFILRRSARENVYRTHYVMALLGLMKSLSLFFHGVNYGVIEINGYHNETWAVLFYITHLMKGALLFVTILLLGTGWTFIKHVLSDREKKMFMIIIPLQLLANVAQIILEESEVGDIVHTTWRQVLYLVDIICCAAILFPVVWSIRHLQEASKTDGKAVMNLKKLQLFRHFYIMIVCYIYFTRIVVYLLKIMVPFRYEWVDELFREFVTYAFFMLTSIKFQPADNNPYFQVPLCEDDPEADEVLTQTGLTENVRRVRGRRDTDAAADTPAHDSTSGRLERRQELRSLMSNEDSHDLD